MKRWIFRLVSLLFIIALAILVGRRFSSSVKIETVRPTEQEVVELVIASGRIRAARQSNIGSEIAAKVDQVFVDEGDKVSAGQKLITLRQQGMERQLEQAKLAVETAKRELERAEQGAYPEEIDRSRAELERVKIARKQAELDVNRAESLYKEQLIPLAELQRSQTALIQAQASEKVADQTLQSLLKLPRLEDIRVAEAKLREAEAAVRVAEEELQKRTITAPFDGLIVRRQVEPGQSTTVGSSLLTLADTNKIQIYVETDENNLAKLRTGQIATVIALAYREIPFKAVLTQIDPEVDNLRGVVGLRFRPEQLPAYAKPDMTVDVNIETGRFPNALSLPASCIIEQNGSSYLFLVENGRAKQKEVKIKARNNNIVAVDGIMPSDEIILQATLVKEAEKVERK
ncbi:MAG: efflux RND transporter periplasmic adaptor subunit [Blastocatellia bacterium]|nr:efflux RND transporter periplasmic adaptor subunit [Blastocatellia bacterium]